MKDSDLHEANAYRVAGRGDKHAEQVVDQARFENLASLR